MALWSPRARIVARSSSRARYNITCCLAGLHTQQAEDGVYTGQMFRGRREGRGVLVGKDGSRYEGEFKNGKEHGQGEITFANGNKYVGQWKGGKKEGKGLFTWSDDATYDGEWKNEMMHGRGVWMLFIPSGRFMSIACGAPAPLRAPCAKPPFLSKPHHPCLNVAGSKACAGSFCSCSHWFYQRGQVFVGKNQ